MFESKLILKLPPFPLTYTVREKRRQFQNELTLKHSEVILELSWLYEMWHPLAIFKLLYGWGFHWMGFEKLTDSLLRLSGNEIKAEKWDKSPLPWWAQFTSTVPQNPFLKNFVRKRQFMQSWNVLWKFIN